MKNRKWWAFLVAVAAIVILSILDKPSGISAITTIVIALFAANVTQKSKLMKDGEE